MRDACILLANERPYREYPYEWINRALTRMDNITIKRRKMYPLRQTYKMLVKQIDVGRSKLQHFQSSKLKEEMANVLDDLDKQSLELTKKYKDGKFRSGFNYVFVVEKDLNVVEE